ncbi:MAG: hypothetical protein RET84_23785 [Pseudomonadota bacterium]|nr:hypothetical protein [Pseudomonadota bacterium]
MDEAAVAAACDAYVFILNTDVHRHKPINARPHRRMTPPWLLSQAFHACGTAVQK